MAGDFSKILASLKDDKVKSDKEVCLSLQNLKVLFDASENLNSTSGGKGRHSLSKEIDSDGLKVIVKYMDRSKPKIIRTYASLATSSYLDCSGLEGGETLVSLLKALAEKQKIDDIVLAFSAATCLFPSATELMVSMVLTENFGKRLEQLMRQSCRDDALGFACLEMLDVACLNASCREAIQLQCTEWLEIIFEFPGAEVLSTKPDPDPISQRLQYKGEDIILKGKKLLKDSLLQKLVISPYGISLACLVLAKSQAVPLANRGEKKEHPLPKTDILELNRILMSFVSRWQKSGSFEMPNQDVLESSLNGLMISSHQSIVKESMANDEGFVEKLLEILRTKELPSILTYSILAIFDNLTKGVRPITENEKQKSMLNAYMNGQGQRPTSEASDTLDDKIHVEKRRMKVFKAGIVPALVMLDTKITKGSLGLVATLIMATSEILPFQQTRGNMAQQGVIRLLLRMYYDGFPSSDGSPTATAGKRNTSQGLARILTSVNTELLYIKSSTLLLASIEPLLCLLEDDPDGSRDDELPIRQPAFESLMALGNLASLDDSVRDLIVQQISTRLNDFLSSEHVLIVHVTLQLITNLVMSERGAALFIDGSQESKHRFRILWELNDSTDVRLKLDVGAIMANMSSWPVAASWILGDPPALSRILAMVEDISSDEGIRVRGINVINNLVTCPDEMVAQLAILKFKELDGSSKVKKGLNCLNDEETKSLMLSVINTIR